jgi:hypothetical protein
MSYALRVGLARRSGFGTAHVDHGSHGGYDSWMSAPPDALEKLPLCPICGNDLVVAHEHSRLKVCVCRLCGTSVTIPDDAWLKARLQGLKGP